VGTTLGVLAARDPDMQTLDYRAIASVATEATLGSLLACAAFPEWTEAATVVGTGIVMASTYFRSTSDALRRALKAAAEREDDARSVVGFVDEEGTWRPPLAVAVER